MFTVKATYRGEIRKFTFSGNSFPSFDQLSNQLYRFFPSSSNYYLSRLLFSPDASQSSRLLIGQEVFTAEDYERCILHHKNRVWANALLRFSVLDATPHKTPCVAPETTTTPAQPLMSDIWSTQGSTVSASSPFIGAGAQPPPLRPISLSHLPAPIFSTPPRAFTQSVETTPLNHFTEPFFPSFSYGQSVQSQPTPDTQSMSSCCSIAQSKTEVQNLISDFQRNLNDLLSKTFGPQSMSDSQNTQFKPTIPPTPQQPFWLRPVLCVSCYKNVEVIRQFTCENCRTILCFACYISGKSGFCTSSMGSHFIKETTQNTSSPTFSVPYQSHPWPPSGVIHHHTPAWAPSWQPLPPAAPAVVYPSDPYTPVTPFIPPLPSSHVDSPWRSCSPVIHHSPPSTVTPYPPSPVQAPVPAPIPTPPRPPIHRGILCDMCDKVIEGVRHKCLDCHDYDLCTSCISTGFAERHNPFHEFFEVTEPGHVIVHTLDAPRRDPSSFNDRSPIPAPAPAADHAVIHSARCDLCDSRIEGYRYKCAICPDFDTCSSCFNITREQHPGHSFVKLSKVDDYIQRDFTFPPQHNATCDACNSPITGIRFKCMHSDCPDFDLCERCEAHPIPMHPDKHPLLKIKSVETVIPKIHNDRVISPQTAILRAYDYEDGHIYNPSASSTEFVPPSPVNTPPNFGSSPMYDRYPLPPFHDLPSEDRSSHPVQPCLVPDRYIPYPSRSASPPISHTSAFVPPAHTYTGVASPIIAQSNARDYVEPSDPSPRSSRPVTPVWRSFYEPTMNNPFMSAQEAASSPLDAKKSSPSAMSRGTWLTPSHELDHLIQEQPSLTVAPKPFYEEAQDIVYGNNILTPSDRNTPLQSPLGNEALLNRPASMNVPELSDVVPVSSVNRSLAALLDDYRSATSLAPSPLAASVDEQEVPSHFEAQKALTADFVADITVPDGQNFPAGAEFVKCWRMVNDGERDWPESTELVFVAGTPLLKESSPVNVKVGLVKIGSEVDLWTGGLKAPDVPGRYIGYWRLRDDQGQLFGNTIWVEINVIEATREPSDHSLASSSIIMPNVPPSHSNSPTHANVPPPSTAPSVTDFSKLRSNSDISSEDDMSDSSSVSLVSAPFSEEDEDDRLWEASRAHEAAESVAQNMEYVVLYDDNTSDED